MPTGFIREHETELEHIRHALISDVARDVLSFRTHAGQLTQFAQTGLDKLQATKSTFELIQALAGFVHQARLFEHQPANRQLPTLSVGLIEHIIQLIHTLTPLVKRFISQHHQPETIRLNLQALSHDPETHYIPFSANWVLPPQTLQSISKAHYETKLSNCFIDTLACIHQVFTQSSVMASLSHFSIDYLLLVALSIIEHPEALIKQPESNQFNTSAPISDMKALKAAFNKMGQKSQAMAKHVAAPTQGSLKYLTPVESGVSFCTLPKGHIPNHIHPQGQVVAHKILSKLAELHVKQMPRARQGQNYYYFILEQKNTATIGLRLNLSSAQLNYPLAGSEVEVATSSGFFKCSFDKFITHFHDLMFDPSGPIPEPNWTIISLSLQK